MFKQDLRNETISLGAIYQACNEIKKVAWQGEIDTKLIEPLIFSVYQTTADNIDDIYINLRRINTGLDVEDWSRQVEKIGAGEIFLTSIDNDGSRKGYDLDLMKKVSSSVKIPIIGFGGVWTWDHLVDGILEGGLDAVGVGNVFHFKEHSTKQAKKYLLEKGINVRKDSFFKIKSNFKPSYEDVL